ncbi:GDCCVxC domain-containing (seleno)protein [Paraburkholderia sp. GAS334]|uniref:GDCCVxC domain-containing (seleno)protein n=1 Tax=Paraburkholderia sp. GAS334 TaxID=3035131 RepID=UPI003D195377
MFGRLEFDHHVPVCGQMKDESMLSDASIRLYACEYCKEVLRPKLGDCCVYCSYGTTKCPPMQQSGSCCGG